MALNTYEDLNDMQMDALREIGNIGSGNAASALSSMLDRPIDINVPRISILDYKEVIEQLGGPESVLVGMLFSLDGDVSGMMMFLLQQEFASMTLGALIGTELDNISEAGELELSAIKEVGNIMAASYVNAIASLAGLEIGISVPDICIDMAGAVLSVPEIHYANISDKIIYIDDDFNSENENSSGRVLMIPEVESLNKIMENLGIGI